MSSNQTMTIKTFNELKKMANLGDRNLNVYEDSNLILKIPPSKISCYNDCVRDIYKELLHKYSVKYHGVILAINPAFKVFETFASSFQDNYELYLKAQIELILCNPIVGKFYKVCVIKVIYFNILLIPRYYQIMF